MKRAVRLLARLNSLFSHVWYSMEVRILANEPAYFLVHHYLDGPNTYDRYETLAELTESMSDYIRQVEKNRSK